MSHEILLLGNLLKSESQQMCSCLLMLEGPAQNHAHQQLFSWSVEEGRAPAVTAAPKRLKPTSRACVHQISPKNGREATELSVKLFFFFFFLWHTQ